VKRFALIGIVVLVALGAAACEGDKTTVVNSPPGQAQTGITVSGRGEVQAPPDTGFFQVGVQVRAANVADARTAAAKAADAVTKSVKSNGVGDNDIKTTNYSINPEYDNRINPPRVTGYVIANTIEVKVRKIDSLSKVIDDATAAGGDAARVQGVRFDIEDNGKLLEQARKAAVDDARKKAEQLASQTGAKLGKPISISETQSSAPQPVALAAGRVSTDSSPAVPISPGTGSVTVILSIVWAIEN
jgi:hypothetical protein